MMQPVRWTVVEAKGRFSALVDQVMSEGPQIVTRNGADAVVLVAAQAWRPGLGRRSALDVLVQTDARFAFDDASIAAAFPRLGAAAPAAPGAVVVGG